MVTRTVYNRLQSSTQPFTRLNVLKNLFLFIAPICEYKQSLYNCLQPFTLLFIACSLLYNRLQSSTQPFTRRSKSHCFRCTPLGYMGNCTTGNQTSTKLTGATYAYGQPHLSMDVLAIKRRFLYILGRRAYPLAL